MLQAHSLGCRQDATRALAGAVHTRVGGQADEVRLRLTVEIFVAAWRTAFLSWTTRGGEGGRRPLRRAAGGAYRTGLTPVGEGGRGDRRIQDTPDTHYPSASANHAERPTRPGIPPFRLPGRTGRGTGRLCSACSTSVKRKGVRRAPARRHRGPPPVTDPPTSVSADREDRHTPVPRRWRRPPPLSPAADRRSRPRSSAARSPGRSGATNADLGARTQT
ncbi:hypothetical protein ACFU5N_26210 [Streptomyces albidoflavus]